MPEVREFTYNPEERSILRLAKEFSDLLGTPAWKEYEKILRAQIETRETLLRLPVSESNPAFSGMDFMTRAASQEVIKGAIIGLRLALDIPGLTMKHGKDIVAEHGGEADAA